MDSSWENLAIHLGLNGLTGISRLVHLYNQIRLPDWSEIRDISTQFSGFKLATSTHVLSQLDVFHYCHIPQALRFHYYLCSVETSACTFQRG